MSLLLHETEGKQNIIGLYPTVFDYKQTVRYFICHIAGIYYESFNFANFVNQKALAKIKASIYFCINIVHTKCIASN